MMNQKEQNEIVALRDEMTRLRELVKALQANRKPEEIPIGTLGATLRRLRGAAGLSAVTMAKTSGTSYQSLCLMEKSGGFPRGKTLTYYEKALGLTRAQIIQEWANDLKEFESLNKPA